MRSLPLAVLFSLSAASAGWAAPVNTLDEIVPALTRCWRAPSGSAGSELTIALALRSDGQLLGQPRITHRGSPAIPSPSADL
jgi:hypothetical protein